MAEKNASFRSIFMHADAVDKLLMTIGFLGAVGDGLAFPASLFVTAKILNSIASPSLSFSTERINNETMILCYVAFAQGIACFLEGYCWTRTAERQAAALRVTYLKSVLRQEVSYFDLQLTSTAEVIASVSSDSLVIQDFISEKLPMFIANIFTFLGGYIVSFLMLWRLAIVGFPFVLFLVIPGLVYGRVLMGIAREIRVQNGKADTIVEKAISSIHTVYSFVGEAKTSADYSAALEKTLKLGLKQGLAKGLAVGSNGIVYAIWSFVCYYGSRLVMYHGAKGGTIYAVGVALNVGGLSLGSGLPMLRYLSEASEAAERTMEIIERVPKIDSLSMEGETLPNVKGEVEFRHVEFAYPSRPESLIFKDFNLKIPAERTVALIGESGSGKSSALALLQRFYDPLRGEILVDGIRIQKLHLKWLRSQMGLVSQEPALFATTIKENIVFGKEDASLQEVIQAAKSANAHDFISQLPQGYDTQVGERGVQMSGGQKQRIAIARAIIKAPKILLLDEATSALDAESERVVQEALDKVAVGVTTIVIAHQLSTIRNADLIAVVKNGQIMESGSHNQLIAAEDSLYSSLVHLQQTDQLNSTLVSSSFSNSSGHTKLVSSFGRSSSSHKGQIIDQDPISDPSFTRLFAMSLPEWKQGLASCTGAVLFGAVPPLYSFTMGAVLWAYFLPDHKEIKKKTEIYCLCFAGLALFSLLTNICQHYNFAAMAECLTKRIREGMLSRILTFEIGWFDRDENATGAICSRLAKDANVVRSLIGDRMSLLIQTVSSVVISCIMALIISWRLSIVLIAAQPLMVGCYYFRLVILKAMSAKAIKSQNESSKIAAEAVSNIRIVTSFSSQNRILEMLRKAQQGPRLESIRQSWLAGTGLAMSNMLLRLSWSLSFWYGGKLTSTGALKAEAFFQVFLIVFNTGRGIAEAGRMTNDISKGSSSVGSVFSVLDRTSLIQPDDPDGRKPDTIIGHIELHDVDFAYPSRPEAMIFKEFSLEMEPSKSTALVGRSGSGKSTIIGLIERFYDPLKGAVKIDGRDIRSYHLRELRKHIALVSQEPALFSGTIRENITYGSTNAADEWEMIAAARAANAHEFITGLKDGYDTHCGDKGVQLSGGQKQRIAIARAVVKNPRMLLLDEATSALDSRSEKLVQEALDQAMIGRTSVVVAHRLSTIQSCDSIAVVDGGQVVEKGSHSSLVAKGPNGAYFSLLTIQTKPIS